MSRKWNVDYIIFIEDTNEVIQNNSVVMYSNPNLSEVHDIYMDFTDKMDTLEKFTKEQNGNQFYITKISSKDQNYTPYFKNM